MRVVIVAGIVGCLFLLGVASPADAKSLECGRSEVLTTGCSVDATADDAQVTLIGSAVAPGLRPGRLPAEDSRVRRNKADADVCKIPRGNRCFGVAPRPASPPAASAATPSVTLRDIAAFRPAPGSQQMEPNGWVVPGLDANFYAIVGQQLVIGTLLGQPATVRFTPVGYHWNYGDGTAVVRTTKGSTWAQLGLHDFDPSPTSHVYETEGEYVIRLTIDFRAEYQFGAGTGAGGFRPVTGTINLPANELRVTVTGAKTVLVDHDCVANPAGPGC